MNNPCSNLNGGAEASCEERSGPGKARISAGVACGGTGGHVFPGLAVASVLRARGHEAVLWVTGREEERSALEGWDGRVVTVRVPRVLRSVRGGLALPGMLSAFFKCMNIMRRRRPDVMLAMGSYTSVCPALAARLLGVPLVLHEANVVPGRAIRFLSRFAVTVATGFKETGEALRRAPTVLTGMPLRDEVDDGSEDERLRALGRGGWTVLVMGGSRGAHALNMIASSAIIALRGRGLDMRVIHLAGAADAPALQETYRAGCVPSAVFGFLHSVGRAYGRASFAVCRAGASTCAELARYGVPALLVPYPFATHQHQSANARSLERAGAADVREEKDLSVEWLNNYLVGRMEDGAGLERMRQAAGKLGIRDAAAVLADLVERAALRR